MRWFITLDEYRERFPPTSEADPPSRDRWPAPPERPDGPIATHVESIISPRLPGDMTLADRWDFLTSGHMKYKTTSGAGFTVTWQRMTRPLPIEAVGPTHLVMWPSGSEVALVDRLPKAFHQIVLVRASGVMLNVTAFGLLGKHLPPPVTMGELEVIMRSLDADVLDALTEYEGDETTA